MPAVASGPGFSSAITERFSNNPQNFSHSTCKKFRLATSLEERCTHLVELAPPAPLPPPAHQLSLASVQRKGSMRCTQRSLIISN